MQLISESKLGVAFSGRRVRWMTGEDPLPIELVERRTMTTYACLGRLGSCDEEGCCPCLPPVRIKRDTQFFQVKISIAKGSNGEPGHEHPGTG
jgi:hypothetical protein